MVDNELFVIRDAHKSQTFPEYRRSVTAMVSTIHKLLQYVEDPEHPSLGVILNVQKFTGLWHPDLKSTTPRLKLLLYYVIIAFFMSQYIKCAIIFNPESLILILRYLPFHMGVLKTCVFQKDYKYWEELVRFISSIERKQSIKGDEEQDRIVKGYIRHSRRVTYFFFTLALFSNFAVFSEPYRNNQVSENGSVYNYLFEGYTPFQRVPPGYYCSMIIQTVFGYMMTIYIITWDMMTVTVMIFFVGQLRMCSLYCSRIISVKNFKQSERNIAECHQFYTTLVLHLKKFNALISSVMFVYLVIISVNLGVCIKQIAELKDDLPTKVSSCIYIVACFIQLLLFYWHSNEVTFESARVSYNTIKSEWVGADLRLQRQVALLAWTTTKRRTFTAGPFNEMSLSTFVAILHRSYSFYTLLKETN